jgi:hypothetical protein
MSDRSRTGRRWHRPEHYRLPYRAERPGLLPAAPALPVPCRTHNTSAPGFPPGNSDRTALRTRRNDRSLPHPNDSCTARLSPYSSAHGRVSAAVAPGTGTTTAASHFGHLPFLPACSSDTLNPVPHAAHFSTIIFTPLSVSRHVSRDAPPLILRYVFGSPHKRKGPAATTPVEGLRQPVDETSPTDSQTGVHQVRCLVESKMPHFSAGTTAWPDQVQVIGVQNIIPRAENDVNIFSGRALRGSDDPGGEPGVQLSPE